jgi:hypothetical protein
LAVDKERTSFDFRDGFRVFFCHLRHHI